MDTACKLTPGDSKQQRFVCLVVLWQEAWPDTPQLVLNRGKSAAGSTGVTNGEATATLAKVPMIATVENMTVWMGLGSAMSCTMGREGSKKSTYSVH